MTTDRWPPLHSTAALITRIEGNPAAKGSFRAMTTKTGRAVLVPGGSTLQKNALRDWNRAVVARCSEVWDGREPLDGPLAFSAIFWHAGPPKSATSAWCWKNSSATGHPRVPDLDKVIRATWDGITEAGVWVDDSRVAGIPQVAQMWADAEYSPGAHVVVARLADVGLDRGDHD